MSLSVTPANLAMLRDAHVQDTKRTTSFRRKDLEDICRTPPKTFTMTTEELESVMSQAILAERARCLAIITHETPNAVGTIRKIRNPKCRW